VPALRRNPTPEAAAKNAGKRGGVEDETV